MIISCGTQQTVADFEGMEPAAITPDSLIRLIPDYSEELHTMTGHGRALVSEPGNSERVSVDFQSDRDRSLLTIRTSIGIEGGQILIDSDSLLIYNKVDNIAQKVSPEQSTLSSVGSIASLNMLDLFNFRITESEINQIFDSGSTLIVLLDNQAAIELEKSTGLIRRVDRSRSDPPVPYRTIEYEGYAEINGFQLPRKITIYSADGRSRATFLVQQLHVNGKLPPLVIDLPEGIPIQRP
ncbi:DUF4292 domain-containing protein [Rhodohalobacter sp. SW132]|nr:DUF4292 domain-containing protein [Rhodohalobacter sp. SW132]